MKELRELGFGNFDENLKRIKKFKDDHVNRVIDDYADNPINQKEEEKKV